MAHRCELALCAACGPEGHRTYRNHARGKRTTNAHLSQSRANAFAGKLRLMTLSAGIALGDDSLRAVALGRAGGPDRLSVPPALWRSRSGGLVVGADPAGAGAVYRDFADRVGDPVPVIGSDGTARFGADLVALTAAGLLHRATQGLAPDQLVITYPAAWGRYEVSMLHSALGATWVNGIPAAFVSSPVATAVSAESAGALRAGEAALVVDIGGRRTDLALVGGAGRARRVVTRSGTDELGSTLLDRSLAAHIVAQSAIPEPDPAEPGGLAALRDAVERAGLARAELMHQPATVVEVCLPAGTERVRVIRSELDALISGPISAGVAAIAHMLAEAHHNGTQVAAVLLTGEAVRTPLLTELLSARIQPRALFPPDPEWTVAGAAADIAVRRARPRHIEPPAAPRPRTAGHGLTRAA